MNAQKLNLETKLRQIRELEEKHRLLGVSFAVKSGAKVLTEESVDYVLNVIETAVQDIKELDSIPTSTSEMAESGAVHA